MKSFSITTTDHAERSLGSSFDPLLNGVAQGLAKLFPPIENTHRSASDDDAARRHEAEDERPGE